MKEFLTRTLSGLIYACLMIGSILWHPLFFLAVFLFILIMGMMEFYRFASQPAMKPMTIQGILTGATLFVLLFLTRFSGLDIKILLIVPGMMAILLAWSLFRPKADALTSTAFTFLGLIYVALPVSLFNLLVYHPYHEGFNYQVVLFMFFILWINDTGAYISGLLLGKHRMFPRISPKKSWEGLAGGVILALVATWLGKPLFKDIPHTDLWVLCLVIVISGTFGDLIESGWKRSAGVKDSGNIMPGHGGVLDRFDSLILASPAVYITLNFLT